MNKATLPDMDLDTDSNSKPNGYNCSIARTQILIWMVDRYCTHRWDGYLYPD